MKTKPLVHPAMLLPGLVSLLLAGCSGNEQAAAPDNPDSTLCEQVLANQHAQGAVLLPTKDGRTVPVEYRVYQGWAIIEGDLGLGAVNSFEKAPQEVLTMKGGLEIKGIIVERPDARWPDKKIYYTIDAGLPDKRRVRDAIKHWEANTEIRFFERKTEADYVDFITAEGCYSSHVGRAQGRQEVGLSADCVTGNVIHEIGHVVGLWHEQSREDRNKYVMIDLNNVQVGQKSQFLQHITDGTDVDTYDHGSIMHYGRYAFAINPRRPTIETIPVGKSIGQRDKLSLGDIRTVKALYP